MFWNRKKNDSCTIEENDSMKNEQLLRNKTQTILDDDLYKSLYVHGKGLFKQQYLHICTVKDEAGGCLFVVPVCLL